MADDDLDLGLEDGPDIDVSALIASTQGMLDSHKAAASASTGEIDVAALLRETSAADVGADAELTADDLEDDELLSDLKDIGWVEDEGGDVPRAHQRSRAHAHAPRDTPPPPSPVTVATVDERIAECLREALECKQRGDRDGALGWLASKKALMAVRDEAAAGTLTAGRLPARPGRAGAESAAAGASRAAAHAQPSATRAPGGVAVSLLAPPPPPPPQPPPQQAAGAVPQPRLAPAAPRAPPALGVCPAALGGVEPTLPALGGGGGAPRRPASALADQHPGGIPPPARPLGPDDLEIVICRAELSDERQLPSAAPHSFVTWRLPLPNSSVQEGKTELVRSTTRPAYNSPFLTTIDRRKGSTANAFAHRRLSVELHVVAHTGLRRFVSAGPALLGKADVKIAPLLHQHELAVRVPLRPASGTDSPGAIVVCVRLASPIIAPPPPPPPPPPTSAPDGRAGAGAPARGGGTPPPGGAGGGAGAARAATPPAPPAEGEEVDDFSYAEAIESFDVLSWELEELGARKGVYARMGADALQMRRDALEFRKQLIEIKVSSGQLTMDAYLQALCRAIATEQAAAAKHKASGTIPGKMRAVHSLKRVKVMKDELLGAEKAMAEEGDDADEGAVEGA